MEQVTWVVDDYILRSDWQKHNLHQAIEETGSKLISVNYIPFSEKNEPVDLIEPFVIYGTHGYIINARKDGLSSGIFCQEDKLSITNMLKQYPRDWILNDDSQKVLLKNLNDYIEDMGIPVHIRPDRCDKLFAGCVLESPLEYGSFHEESIKPWKHDISNEAIMVSAAKNIDCEMRFVIINQEVEAGSCYRFNGILDVRRDVYPAAQRLAEKVAKHDFQPDEAYTVDIAKTGDSFKIIELNSFSCAGFYACNSLNIVTAMNSLVKSRSIFKR